MDGGSDGDSESRFAAYLEQLGTAWAMLIDRNRCAIIA
jgi:hypothetical protein